MSADESGQPWITIGHALPRRLEDAGGAAWVADGLTVRADRSGSALLISVPGAHHVRFDPVR